MANKSSKKSSTTPSTPNSTCKSSSGQSLRNEPSSSSEPTSNDFIDLGGDSDDANEDDAILVIHDDEDDAPSSPSDVEVIDNSASHKKKMKKKQNDDDNNSRSTPSSKATLKTNSSLLSRALHGAHNAAQSSTATPNASSSSKLNDSIEPSPRTQFEQQQDFISFDFNDDHTSSHGSPRGADDSATWYRDRNSPSRSGSSTPRGAARESNQRRDAMTSASGSKRKLDEYEEKREQGTRDLRRREKERSTPWCLNPGVEWDKARNAIEMLNLEAKAFIHYISPTPIEHELRLWTIELIRRTIQSRWVDSDVECFGSVGTGLYLPGGDIDLVVLCPTMPSPPLKPSSSLLHKLAALLLKSSIAEPESLVVIAKARVPIVKFVTRYGGFSVDLSVNQENGVDAAVRVRKMLEDFAFRDGDYVEPGSVDVAPSNKGKEKEKKAGNARAEEVAPLVDHGVARSLVLLVKAFLNQRGMNEVFTGGLGSYSIICLVISFLQLHPKIQTSAISPSHNIGLLFVEFLEYYGRHFNYDTTGITLRQRGGYFNKHDKGWYRANQPYLLSIEDPNDPTNDVSGGSHGIVRVRQTLSGGFESITATLFHRESHFQHRDDHRFKPLDGSALPLAMQDDDDPFKMSILGSVIGMTTAGSQARKENIDLHSAGTLQALLKDLPRGTYVNPSSGNQIDPTGLSKKQIKKLKKEMRENEKREKTRAKLERRAEEKKKNKAKKKGGEESTGFVIDTVGARTPVETIDLRDEEDDDEEESRYAIASPKARANGASATTFVRGRSSDDGEEGGYNSSDGDSSEHDDADVMMGGGSGDLLIGSTASSIVNSLRASPQPSSSRKRTESEDSDAHVAQSLKRIKTTDDDEKKQAKAAFWAAKGTKETAGGDDEEM